MLLQSVGRAVTTRFSIGEPVEFVTGGRRTLVLAVHDDLRVSVIGSAARFPMSAFRRVRNNSYDPEE
jgi:hypothetical protein